MAILAAGLAFAAGCSAARDEAAKSAIDAERGSEPSLPNETSGREGGNELGERLRVFADEAFYRELGVPEASLRGVLIRSDVRLGPNTREMPLRLVVGDTSYPVYVAGLDLTRLDPYVDRQVEIVGKWVDQTAEGFETEIWVGSISLALR